MVEVIGSAGGNSDRNDSCGDFGTCDGTGRSVGGSNCSETVVVMVIVIMVVVVLMVCW